MEQATLPIKKTDFNSTPLDYVSDFDKESILARSLSQDLGHPVIVRVTSLSGSNGIYSLGLEFDSPTPEQGARYYPVAGHSIKQLSDVALAEMLSNGLEEATNGTRYRAVVTGRSYGGTSGLASYRPKPTRVTLLIEERA